VDGYEANYPDFLAAVLKGQHLQAFGQAEQSLALPV
jgi:hypothetical protein